MSLQHERKDDEHSSPGSKSITPHNVFISHTKVDIPFVDKIATDLEKQGFHTLVYRPSVVEGPDWTEEVENLIDQSQALLVILSPEAANENHITIEYRYAAQQHKAIVPVLYRPVQWVDVALNQVPWITLDANNPQGMKHAMWALTLTAMFPTGVFNPWIYLRPMVDFAFATPQPPPFPTLPTSDDLYRLGVDAEAQGNLDYAVFLWEQVLYADPGFRGGILPPRLAELQAKLHPIHKRRLLQQAEEAYRKAMWSLEIQAWNDWGQLARKASQAERRIAIAAHHQKYDGEYNDARSFVRDKNIPAAKLQLKHLWKIAPLYPDPDQLAAKVGLPAHLGFIPFQLALRRGSASGTAWGLCLGMIAGGMVANFMHTNLDPTINLGASLEGLVGCVLIGSGLALLGGALDRRFGKIALAYAMLHCLLVGGVFGLLVNAIDAVFLLRMADMATLETLLGGFSTAQLQMALLPGLIGGGLVSLLIGLAIAPLFRSYPANGGMFASFGLSGVAIGFVGGSVLGYATALHGTTDYSTFLSTIIGLLVGGIILGLLGGLVSALTAILLVKIRELSASALYK